MWSRIETDYKTFCKAIEGFCGWTYTSSVLDKDKKICLKVNHDSIELAVKSSNILAKGQIKASTDKSDDETDYFIVDYLKIKGILETYSKLEYTYIKSLSFYENENYIEMVLDEYPLDGCNEAYRQEQKYKLPKGSAPYEKYYGRVYKSKIKTTNPENVGLMLDYLVPKMKPDMQLQFEGKSAIVKSVNTIYTCENPLKGIMEDMALTHQECNFIRNLNKRVKGEITYANSEECIIILWEQNIAYLSKASIKSKVSSIFKHKEYEWEYTIKAGYYKNILQRFRNAEDAVIFHVDKENHATISTKSIEQNVVLDSMQNGLHEGYLLIPKTTEDMILSTKGDIRVGFINKSSRGKVIYSLSYMEGTGKLSWVCITQVRKG